MSSFPLKFTLESTNPMADLCLSVLLDDQCIYQIQPVPALTHVECNIPEDECRHQLKFQLSNKQPEDTQVDEQGIITQDSLIRITNISFDNIELGYNILQSMRYEHDFNGTGEPVVEKFFDDMGCNGTVTLDFELPFYLWLLENM